MSKGKTDVQTFMSSPGREESFLNEGTLTRFYKGEDRSDTSFDLDLKSITWDYDLLTGLPCMKKFLDLVSTDFQQYENYVFLYFNLTNFKLFNAKYGMEAGDQLLIEIANILKNVFKNDCLSRFSDDHFAVFTKDHELETKIKRAYQLIRHQPFANGIDVKIGVYKVKERNINPQTACDMAKIACDSMRTKNDRYFEYYKPELLRRMELADYIITHIDEAVANDYIKVYYQPVIRTLNRTLCGMEALARWIDPVKGFMSPGDFIPVLEENHLIHKLDRHIAKLICQNYSKRVADGEPIMPVSFNLSRLDFLSCDMFEVLEKYVKEYKVPRDMIHIEITESVFVEDGLIIGDVIRRFHNAGYQVWMDDFGSGFSSLNVLKDYDFDELKIDMVFLSHFNNRSKEIVKSTVGMAKNIGIQSLAEGVETEEQLAFLREIGCEKAQGYLFSKPSPYMDALNACISKGIQVETRARKEFFDALNKVDFMTDSAFAIIEDDGEKVEFLFANKDFVCALKENDIFTKKQASAIVNSPHLPVAKLYRRFIKTVIRTRQPEVVSFPLKKAIVQLEVTCLSQCQGHYLHHVRMSDRCIEKSIKVQRSMNMMLRNIYYLYDEIMIYDLSGSNDHLNLTPTLGKYVNLEKGLEREIELYCLEKIFPEDQQRFREFADKELLSDYVKTSVNGASVGYFRTRDENGNYPWKMHTIIPIPQECSYMHCVNKTAFKDVDFGKAILKDYYFSMPRMKELDRHVKEDIIIKSELWDNMITYSNTPYFWKNENREYEGVSDTFLDYYKLKGKEDIIGKKDEDLHWYINEGQIINEEEDILKNGVIRQVSVCQSHKEGLLKDTIIVKKPYYKDGFVAGLIGYIVNFKEGENVVSNDPITGLLNYDGIVKAAISYEEDYHIYGIEFACIIIEIMEYDRIIKAYGREAGTSLLRKAAGVIYDTVDGRGTVGRLEGFTFKVMTKFNKREEVEKLSDKIKKALYEIHEVAGFSCTIFPHINIHYASDIDGVENLFYQML